MAAPPTLVATIVAADRTSGSSTRTTPTFNVAAGDLLLIYGYTGDGGLALNTPTWTGPGAITLLRSVNIVNRAGLYCWTVQATGALSNVSISCTSNFSAAWWLAAHVYRNHGGVGASASSNTASGTVTLTLPLPVANSAISMGICDYNASSAARTYRAPGVFSAKMVEDAAAFAAPDYSATIAHTDDIGAAGSENAGISAPVSAWTGIAVEVYPAAGSSAGSAGLSGAGTLGATGTATTRTGALSGAGTLTGGGVAQQFRTGSAGLAGAGSLAGTGRPKLIRTTMLGGIGTLRATGSRATLEQYVYRPSPVPDRAHRVQWRYIAQRILTGEFLEWELPIATDGPEWKLSGPGTLAGTIKPEKLDLIADDGELVLQEWGTAIYAEADGEIRWGGVVVRSSFAGAEWRVEAAGFAAYPNGIPYTGVHYARIQWDPTDIFRAIWTHVQTQPDGDLGLEVLRPSPCPVKIGAAAIPGYMTYKAADGKFYKLEELPAGSKVIFNARSSAALAMNATQTTVTLTKLDKFDQVPIGSLISVGTERVKITARSGLKLTIVRGQDSTSAGAHAKAVGIVFDGGTETEAVETVPAEPYVLDWFNATDCGQELDKLAQETPFDYVEEHYWQADGTIGHRVRVEYPRLGYRRTDLAFVQGENVVEVVQATRNGDAFANTVYGIGKGEGALSLRAEVAQRDGRLRRPAVYTDKGADTKTRLTALSRGELARRSLDVEVSSIVVRDHPNARIDSWNIGDDILVEADLPWLGWVEVWSRVVGWALNGEDRATLTLVRSDSFIYGQAVQQ